MQPQGPQVPPGGPYSPYGPNDSLGARPAIPGQPQGPYPPTPQSGPTYPAAQPYPTAPAQPGTIATPQLPGSPTAGPQPAMPQYEMPSHLQPSPKPEEVLPPAPEAAATPYDFFMQPKPITPTTPLPASGRRFGNIPGTFKQQRTGMAKWFPFIVGGGIALVLILGIATMLRPKNPLAGQLFSIAQSQQEIIRICSQGVSKAKYRATRNFAITCSTSVTTNQNELLAYMKSQGLDYDTKQLGAKASNETNSKLTAGISSSTYDDVFRGVTQEELDAYNSNLTAQIGITTGVNGQAILSKAQTANELLLKMVSDNSDKTLAPVETEAAQ